MRNIAQKKPPPPLSATSPEVVGALPGEPANDVTITPVVGEGPEAHRIVRVGAWELTAWVGRGEVEEPRIRDVDLAERLGYERPRKIRDLIDRLRADGKIHDVHVRPAVGRTSMPRGGERETVVDEFWLTEAQALKVAAKSETVKADALLDEIILVYTLARKGLLPQQQPTLDTTAIATALAPLIGPVARSVELLTTFHIEHAARISSIEQKLAAGLYGGGIIPGGVAAGIRGRISRIAKRLADAGVGKYQNERTRIEQRLRSSIHWAGSGAAWINLPVDRMGDVDRELRVLEREAAAATDRAGGTRQLDLLKR